MHPSSSFTEQPSIFFEFLLIRTRKFHPRGRKFWLFLKKKCTLDTIIESHKNNKSNNILRATTRTRATTRATTSRPPTTMPLQSTDPERQLFIKVKACQRCVLLCTAGFLRPGSLRRRHVCSSISFLDDVCGLSSCYSTLTSQRYVLANKKFLKLLTFDLG
jgi:hypothetical protein